MSWALSVLQLRRYYNNVELNTDNTGYDILIETLELPYSSVHKNLESVAIDRSLWVMSKIYSYNMQQEPFLHVDGDIFIWEKFPFEVTDYALIVQNLEQNWEAYKEAVNQIGLLIPKLSNTLDLVKQNGDAYNAGIIGGRDLNFMTTYTEIVIKIGREYGSKLNDIPYINMFLEQKIVHMIAQQYKIQTKCLVHEPIIDPSYHDFARFENVPYQTKFIHALGEFKRQPETCRHLARRLRQDYPAYYYRIVEACKAAGVGMDCRYYQQQPTEAYQAHYERDVRQYRAVQDLFGSPVEAILRQKLYFSPHAQLIETTTEAGSLQQTLLVPDIFTLAEKSIALDPLNMVLLDAFLEQPTTIEAAIAAAAPYFNQTEIEKDFPKFQQLALDRLKELLYAGALESKT